MVDLGSEQDIHSIGATFMQDTFGWYWLPASVTIYTSTDNQTFTPLTTVNNDIPFTRTGFYLKRFGWEGSAHARYIRYVAQIDRNNPKNGYLFTDELIVK